MGTLGDGNAGRWERWAMGTLGNATVRGGVAVDLLGHFRCLFQQVFLSLGEFAEALLPF
jgi:hypothetical protein